MVHAKWLMVIGLSFIIYHLSFSHAVAQTDRQLIREGNKLFRAGQYADAETRYRKAVEANKDNPQAIYNLGNALMAQKKDSAAVEEFQKAAKLEKNPQRKYQAFHNIGVICQTKQMFQDAITAYKEALRLNPHDDQTRYNLELCKRQLKNQPQGGGGGNDDKKQDEQQQQQQQDQQKKDEQKKEEQEQQKPQMSKDNAEQLLNAALQQERQTQKRMQEQQQQQGRRRLKKNW